MSHWCSVQPNKLIRLPSQESGKSPLFFPPFVYQEAVARTNLPVTKADKWGSQQALLQNNISFSSNLLSGRHRELHMSPMSFSLFRRATSSHRELSSQGSVPPRKIQEWTRFLPISDLHQRNSLIHTSVSQRRIRPLKWKELYWLTSAGDLRLFVHWRWGGGNAIRKLSAFKGKTHTHEKQLWKAEMSKH